MAVEHTAPLAIASAVELVGVLEAQQRLGLAVASLLPQVGARVLPAVVPDERARGEGDPVARLLQPPAHVDVVAGLAVLRVEAVDRFQRLAPERHVAARDVLRYLVALQ